MQVVNPATEEVLAQLAEETADGIRAKLAAARRAQPDWGATPYDWRAAAIRRFGERVAASTDRLAKLLTSEMGKPITQSRREITALQERLDFFLDNTAGAIADEVVLQEPVGTSGSGMEERISYEPLGVVANISAWNYPYYVGSNVFVPALLTGNAVLYKPSEVATLTGLAIAELLHEAGVPPDVFTLLAGGGHVGAALLDQPIDALFFTGSYVTGRGIAERLAGRMILVQLELGGKDPIYACDDVDVAGAAGAIAEGAFYNAGQSCCAVERLYVHRRIAEPFLDRFVAAVRGYRVGDPTDESTFLGPLARREQVELLAAHVGDALTRGARLLCGGRRRSGKGYFFEPTVLADCSAEMLVMREESFGPVIGVQVVEDDEEAVVRMNDTEYGLTAGVYSADPERARRILARVDAGSAYWNCCDRVSPRLPWTGRRHSGVGTTLSIAGIRAFVRPRAWHLRPVSDG